jgi:hypothetical protein
MTLTRMATMLLAAAALALPALSSAHACDGDKAEHKAPSAENAQKSDKQDKASEPSKSAPKDDKSSQPQPGKTS